MSAETRHRYPYYNASYSNPTELTNNATYSSEAWIEYWMNRTGPLTTPAIDGVAFPSLPYISNGSTAILDQAIAQTTTQYLAAGTDSTVVNGYAVQKQLITNALQDATRAAYEVSRHGRLTYLTIYRLI